MTSLEERVRLYEKSMSLVDKCSKLLDKADDRQVLEQLKDRMGELCEGRELAQAREKIVENVNSSLEYDRAVEEHKLNYDKQTDKRYVKFCQVLVDDEIVTVREQLNMVDPITKAPLADPVRNNTCGHVYEKSAILSLISKNPKTRCPYVGCRAAGYVKKKDLVEDEELKETLSQFYTEKQNETRDVSRVDVVLDTSSFAET